MEMYINEKMTPKEPASESKQIFKTKAVVLAEDDLEIVLEEGTSQGYAMEIFQAMIGSLLLRQTHLARQAWQ